MHLVFDSLQIDGEKMTAQHCVNSTTKLSSDEHVYSRGNNCPAAAPQPMRVQQQSPTTQRVRRDPIQMSI